ncbi:MAG: hypothetical protein V2I33_17100 [Kangiellaceae bacterium]|jgi:hypothetical protein|nr:hypothetical protein [Kangiellaceae bacterium]
MVRRNNLVPGTIEAAYYLAASSHKLLHGIAFSSRAQNNEINERLTRLEDLLCQRDRASDAEANDQVLARLTCATEDEVEGLVKELSEESGPTWNAVVRRLTLVGGKDLSDIVKKMIALLLTNDMQNRFNRHGTDDKMRFIGPLETAVRAAVRKVLPNETDSDIKNSIATALKNARDRMGGRDRRRQAAEKRSSVERNERSRSGSSQKRRRRSAVRIDDSD